MSNIVTLPSRDIYPEALLNNSLTDLTDIASIIIIKTHKDDTVSVSWSQQTASSLVYSERMLGLAVEKELKALKENE